MGRKETRGVLYTKKHASKLLKNIDNIHINIYNTIMCDSLIYGERNNDDYIRTNKSIDG